MLATALEVLSVPSPELLLELSQLMESLLELSDDDSEDDEEDSLLLSELEPGGSSTSRTT